MEIIQKQRMTKDEAIKCGLNYLVREASHDDELCKTAALIVLELARNKENGIRCLVSSLCASAAAISEIIESLCGKTPQEFIEQELKVKFENIDLNEVK